MAKDKGGKAAKSTSNDDFAKPSEATGGGDGWKLADEANVGRLMLFTPLRTDTTTVTRGKKTEDMDIVVSDIVVIDEKKPEKSEEHTDVYVFPRWVQGSLREYCGKRRVVGRLEQDASKSQGDRPAWVLEDASDADIAKVRAYLDSVDPFAQKGAEKAKGKKK